MKTPEKIADAVVGRFAVKSTTGGNLATILREVVIEEIQKGNLIGPGFIDDDMIKLITTTLNLSTDGNTKVYRYPSQSTLQIKISHKVAGSYDIAPTESNIAPSEDDVVLYRNARQWLLLLMAERSQMLHILTNDRLADTAARDLGRREGREDSKKEIVEELKQLGYYAAAGAIE